MNQYEARVIVMRGPKNPRFEEKFEIVAIIIDDMVKVYTRKIKETDNLTYQTSFSINNQSDDWIVNQIHMKMRSEEIQF